MRDGLETLYEWVRATRAPLMRGLQALGPERYRAPQAALAGQSIRDRHIHMAQCYIHWVARIGLEEDVANPVPSDYAEPLAANALFAAVDGAVARLLDRYAGRLDESLPRTVAPGRQAGFTARWLLAHPVTHEFHHKGQIVVVLRLSGVAPGDTDLAHPFNVTRT